MGKKIELCSSSSKVIRFWKINVKNSPQTTYNSTYNILIRLRSIPQH